MSELQGANTTCYVCGHDYTSEHHLQQCINSPEHICDMDGMVKPQKMSWDEFHQMMLEMYELKEQLETELRTVDLEINDE